MLVLVLASTLISTRTCNLELKLAIASLNRKNIIFILVLVLLFVSICFRDKIRDLMNELVLSSQVTTRLNNA